MSQQISLPTRKVEETVRVSIIVRDDRGFTHYYEDVVTTPGGVRDAFDLMARTTPSAQPPPERD